MATHSEKKYLLISIPDNRLRLLLFSKKTDVSSITFWFPLISVLCNWRQGFDEFGYFFVESPTIVSKRVLSWYTNSATLAFLYCLNLKKLFDVVISHINYFFEVPWQIEIYVKIYSLPLPIISIRSCTKMPTFNLCVWREKLKLAAGEWTLVKKFNLRGAWCVI